MWMMLWCSTYWDLPSLRFFVWNDKSRPSPLFVDLANSIETEFAPELRINARGFFNCNTSTNTINCQCLCDHYNMHNRDYVHRAALSPDVKLWSVGAVMCRSNFFDFALLLAAQYERIFRSAIQQIIKYHDQLKFKLGDNMRALMTMTEKKSGAALTPQRGRDHLLLKIA